MRKGKKVVMDSVCGDITIYRVDGTSIRLALKGSEFCVYEARSCDMSDRTENNGVSPIADMEELIK